MNDQVDSTETTQAEISVPPPQPSSLSFEPEESGELQSVEECGGSCTPS